MLTGGINRQTRYPEAETHAKEVVRLRVPPEKILVENGSTNTMENVMFARPILEARPNLFSGAVVAVTKWYHARRALMTLKRFLPPGLRFYTARYEHQEIRRDNWWQTPIGKKCVLHEWRSIPIYLEQGNLAEITFQDGAWR